MVATLIMGIAVVGLLGNLHVSLRNTDRVATHDRATLFAQHKMDELIAQTTLSLYTKVGGAFPDGEGIRARRMASGGHILGSAATADGRRVGPRPN